jgi:hypothetical protein
MQWADCFFIYDYCKASSDQNKTTTIQALREYLTEYNGVKVKKSEEEIQRDSNKNDNSRYKIVPYEEYRKEYPAFMNGKNIDRVYKLDKNFQDHKSFYSKDNIKDRLKYMELLIDYLKYKTLLLN